MDRDLNCFPRTFQRISPTHSKKHHVVSSRYRPIYAISFKYQKEISLWRNKLKVIAVKHVNCFKAKIHFTLIQFFNLSYQLSFRPWCRIFLDLDARYFVCTLDQVEKMPWSKICLLSVVTFGTSTWLIFKSESTLQILCVHHIYRHHDFTKSTVYVHVRGNWKLLVIKETKEGFCHHYVLSCILFHIISGELPQFYNDYRKDEMSHITGSCFVSTNFLWLEAFVYTVACNDK